MVPDPFPSTEAHWADDTSQAAKISPAHENWRKSASGSDTNWDSGGGNTGTAAGFESMGYMTSNRIDHEFIIDGRSTHEETHWWNPELRERNKRPGPGVLAPVLAEELHASNCSLFSVKVTVPSIAPLPPVPNSKDRVAVPPTPSSSRLQYPIDHSPPTEEEVMASVPHPNAYYCPKDNGWVILSWNSSIAPPLARSYIASRNPHFPDEARRRRVASCIEVGNRPFGKTNVTHHFHKYEKAVDSDKLTPPLRKDKWESLETVEQRRSVGNLHYDDSNIEADDVETLGDNDVESSEEEGKLLDLYVCCQCSFYCVVSGVIPGVIPRRYLEELVRDKNGRPVVGMSAEQSIAVAVKAFLT
jgi:ubiquitin carboxyl-terminal hydrolase 25/28